MIPPSPQSAATTVTSSRRRQISWSDARRLRGCSFIARGPKTRSQSVRISPAGIALSVGVDQVRGDLCAVAQGELVIKAAYIVADCLLTELELSGDLRVVGTLSDHTEHVRLALGQTGGRFVAEDPAGRLVAENLITQMHGDDRSSDRFRGGVLQQNTGGTRDHGWADSPIGIRRQGQCLRMWAFRSDQPDQIDAVGP